MKDSEIESLTELLQLTRKELENAKVEAEKKLDNAKVEAETRAQEAEIRGRTVGKEDAIVIFKNDLDQSAK